MNFGSTSLNNLNYDVGEYKSGEYKSNNLMELLSNIPTFEEKEEKNIKYFKNNKHIFKAVITKKPYGFTIKVGGRDYLDCINITILTNGDIVTSASINHIESEPECAFGTHLEDGEIVNFIKATLQLCQHEFPSLKKISFDDMSNIDCGKSSAIIPPRHLERPFSLAHFSIARYGKTWYETHFGAKMVNNESYLRYRNAVKILYKIIGIDFNNFKDRIPYSEEQYVILEKYFSPEKTWIEFFNSIPKMLQCRVFYNWLPNIITELLNGTYIAHGWYIDIDEMDKTTFKIVEAPKNGGGSKKTRRRRRKTALRFSNQWW